jgi:hypothetical protein
MNRSRRQRMRMAMVMVFSITVLSYLWFNRSVQIININMGNMNPEHAYNVTSRSILLVSAYFPSSRALHSDTEYLTHIGHFLSSVTTDVYFYTTPSFAHHIRELRGSLPLTLDTSFTSAFTIPPLQGLESTSIHQLALDKTSQKHKHSPELYALHAAKPYLLDQAATRSAKTYEHAFWTDAGSFNQAGHAYRHWPDSVRLKALFDDGAAITGKGKDELFYIPTWMPPHASMKWWNEGMGPIVSDFTERTRRGCHLLFTYPYDSEYSFLLRGESSHCALVEPAV